VHGRLTARSVNDIVKAHLPAVLGLNAEVYSSHCLRAGFVTEARQRGVPDVLIARHTRHADLRMLGVYDRPVDLFVNPALGEEWW
jgi:hypothetical protein